MFLSTGKEGERWGRRPRYQRGERVWEAATNLLFCFLSSSFLCSFLVWVLTFLLTSWWTGEKKERAFVLVKVMKEGLF